MRDRVGTIHLIFSAIKSGTPDYLLEKINNKKPKLYAAAHKHAPDDNNEKLRFILNSRLKKTLDKFSKKTPESVTFQNTKWLSDERLFQIRESLPHTEVYQKLESGASLNTYLKRINELETKLKTLVELIAREINYDKEKLSDIHKEIETLRNAYDESTRSHFGEMYKICDKKLKAIKTMADLIPKFSEFIKTEYLELKVPSDEKVKDPTEELEIQRNATDSSFLKAAYSSMLVTIRTQKLTKNHHYDSTLEPAKDPSSESNTNKDPLLFRIPSVSPDKSKSEPEIPTSTRRPPAAPQ